MDMSSGEMYHGSTDICVTTEGNWETRPRGLLRAAARKAFLVSFASQSHTLVF